MPPQDNIQFPFPELLRLGRGGEWTIKGSPAGKRAHVTPSTREMLVPLDRSRSSRTIRAHELGHAQWSPTVDVRMLEDASDIPWIVIQAVEDARINLNLVRSGIDLPEMASMQDAMGISRSALGLHLDGKSDEAEALVTAALVASIGSPDSQDLIAKHAAAPFPRSIQIAALVEKFLTQSSTGYIPFRKTMAAANYLLDLQLGEQPEQQQASSSEEEEEQEQGAGEVGTEESDAPAPKPDTSKLEKKDYSAETKPHSPRPERGPSPEAPRKPRKKEEAKRRRKLYATVGGTAVPKGKVSFAEMDPLRILAGAPAPEEPELPAWGQMTIETPSLPRKYREKFGGKQHFDSDFGLNLLHVERAYEDGKIYRTAAKGSRKGGSILIDCSGSMGLSDEMVRKLVKALPLSIIALYGGNNRQHGTLRIIARRGSMIDLEGLTRPGAGYNIIDGPALEWLAKQPQPRYWYSDGYVTGLGEKRVAAHSDDAQNIVFRANIRRATTVEQITTGKGWTTLVPYSYAKREYTAHDERHEFDE